LEIAGDDVGFTVSVHSYELSADAADVKHTAEHVFSALDRPGLLVRHPRYGREALGPKE
jgi:hypothetical protein